MGKFKDADSRKAAESADINLFFNLKEVVCSVVCIRIKK